VFGKRDIEVKVSQTLVPGYVNLIIDEFTSRIANKYIAQFKLKNPATPFVYVLTEFISRKLFVESFNHFDGVARSAISSVFGIYIRLKRGDLGRPGLRDFFVAAFFLPILGCYFLSWMVQKVAHRKLDNLVRRFIEDHLSGLHLHKRYLGLASHLKYADAIIASHENILDTFRRSKLARQDYRILGVVYPELDEIAIQNRFLIEKEPFIELSGSITPYRQRWIERINGLIYIQRNEHYFGMCVAYSFSDNTDRKRGAFSLHPPQTKKWPYSSPMRIYRALSLDFNLPLLTHYFGQHPLEDVCYVIKDANFIEELYEIYCDRDKAMAFIAPRMSRYNNIVKVRNDTLVENVKAMMV
jgi:hypothetical protein